jgi:hypothetical protein
MVGFPLLLIPLAIYNIIVFLMPGVSFADPLLKLTLMSGAEWPITLSDVLLALGILMLLFEVIKGARPGAKFLTDHLLSLIIFGGAVAEFLLLPRFGSSTYFLLTLLASADFLSGLALRARRGMQVASDPVVSKRAARKAETIPAEPQFEPAPMPASPMPAAASVAEAVLQDRPEPQLRPEVRHPEVLHPEVSRPEVLHGEVLHPDVTPAGSSPEVPSPELQPGHGAPPSPDKPPR